MQMQTWKLQTNQLVFRVLGTVAPRIAANRAYTLFMTPQPRRPSDKGEAVMGAAQKLHATYTGGSLLGYSWGAGPTILLAHGWEGSARNFTTMVMPLVDAGFRVIAFDAPAHGSSDGTTSNVIDYAMALSALITEFGPVYGVVAHSVGAAALVFMMGTMKHYRIRRLVFAGAPCELSDVMARFASKLSLTDQTLSHMHRLTQKRLGVPPSAVSVKTMIPYIVTPGLIIHDLHDPMVPFSDAETIAAHWPGADLIATNGLGHNGILRSPEIIDRIVNFMADQHTNVW